MLGKTTNTSTSRETVVCQSIKVSTLGFKSWKVEFKNRNASHMYNQENVVWGFCVTIFSKIKHFILEGAP